MKRSRRIVLTMMSSAGISAVSAGFVRQSDCGPGHVSHRARDPDGWVGGNCSVTYGGFGGAPHRFHGHGHGHGGG